jgi:LuxR family transcriptional regulator, quorum-sensing system regulator SdiA
VGGAVKLNGSGQTHNFLKTDDEAELWRKLHAICHERLGTTNILYGFTHSIHLIDRIGFTNGLFIKHSYPADYVAKFPNGDILKGDITTAYLYHSNGPFLWDELAKLPNLTAEQKHREALDDLYGFEAGVSLAFRFANGKGVAGLGLASHNMATEVFAKHWAANQSYLNPLLAEFDGLMRPIMVARRLRLAPREKQCLSLSIGGMSAKEIGHHLGITERSVFNILNRARKSLEAGNTIEAVAKALAYDLI